jgi:hypothetical protein
VYDNKKESHGTNFIALDKILIKFKYTLI